MVTCDWCSAHGARNEAASGDIVINLPTGSEFWFIPKNGKPLALCTVCQTRLITLIKEWWCTIPLK